MNISSYPPCLSWASTKPLLARSPLVKSKYQTKPCHGFPRASRAETTQSVYPTIDPKVHYDAQTFANKVVLITGASRGIGAQTALQYARAGASLSLVARTQSSLDSSKAAILREHPSAKVLTFPTDVRDVKRAAEVVAATVAHFGRLDILIANAGTLRPLDKRALCPHMPIL